MRRGDVFGLINGDRGLAGSLRADAARGAVEEALAGAVGVDGVEARVDDGSIVVVVSVDSGADAEVINATLGRYTLTWDIKEQS